MGADILHSGQAPWGAVAALSGDPVGAPAEAGPGKKAEPLTGVLR